MRESSAASDGSDSLRDKLVRIVTNPAAALLLGVFVRGELRRGDVSELAADRISSRGSS